MRNLLFVIGILLVCISCKPEPVLPPKEIPFSCPEGPSLDSLIVSPAQNLPLYITGSFESSRITIGYLRAWKPGSLDTLYSEPSASGLNHSLSLGGFEPSTAYVIQAIAKEDECLYPGPTENILTGTLSANVPSYSLITGDSTAFKGWILLNKQTIPGGILMLNAAGKVVWFQDYSPGYPAFAPTGEGGLVALGGQSKWREIDFSGTITRDIDLPLGASDAEYHHDLLKMENGNLAILYREFRQMDLTSVGGSAADPVACEEIRIFDPSGNLVWSWNLCDAINPFDYFSDPSEAADLGHSNTIALDNQGNFLISFRNFNQVWKIDGSNGQIVWKLGQNGDFHLPQNAAFYRQHSVHYNGENRIMLFDNGDGINRSTSRVLELWVDENNKSVSISASLELPARLFSSKMGSAYRLKNGNFLVCPSDPATVVVLNPSGSIIWEVSANFKSYRAIPIEDLAFRHYY